MSDSVGSVSVDVVPDARGWAEKLKAQIRDQVVKVKVEPEVSKAAEEAVGRKGKATGDKFSSEFDRTVQTKIRAALDALPSGKLKIDPTDAERKLYDLRVQIDSLSQKKLGIDMSDEEALNAINRVRAGLAQLASESPDVRVNVNAFAAEAQLAGIQAQVDKLNGETAKVTVRSGGSIASGTSGIFGFVKGLSLIPALAVAAGAALVPLVAVAGGLAAALAAPLALAGGGAGLFAVLGVAAVAQTEKQIKALATQQKAVDSARLSLEQAKRSAGKNASTSTSVANAQDRLNAAVKTYKAALDDVSPAQQKFIDAQGKLKGAFGDLLQGKSGQALLGPIAGGLDLVAKILPLLEPIIRSVSGAVATLLHDVTRFVKYDGFGHLMHQLAHQIGPDIVTFGRIAGNVFTGLTHLFIIFDRRLGKSVTDKLLSLSRSFEKFAEGAGKSDGLRSFFRYFHEQGPDVGRALGAIARAVAHLMEALAPLSTPVLHAITNLADALDSLPLPVLTGLATAILGVTAALKILRPVMGLISTLGKIGPVGGAAAALTGGALGRSKGVVPVFVTNAGFGVGGAAAGGAAAAEGAGVGILSRLRGGLKDVAKGSRGGTFLGGLLEGAALGGFGSQPDTGSAVDGRDYSQPILSERDIKNQQYAAALIRANAAALKLRLSLMPVATAADGLRANLGKVAAQSELTGHSISRSFAGADSAVAAFQKHLAAIHDKNVAIKVQSQAAFDALQRIQAYRLQDKYFTIYARNAAQEQQVGPGGGMGQLHGGGSGGGGGKGGHGKTLYEPTPKTPVHLHLDGEGQTTLSGYLQGHYDANQKWEKVQQPMTALPKSRGSDTWVTQDHPNRNNGSGKYPRLRSGEQVILLHIPIPTGTLGQDVDTAPLTWQVKGAWSAQTVTVKAASASWTAGEASWNNQPGVRATSVTVTTGALSDGAQVTVDIASLVQPVADGSVKWFGLVITTNAATEQSVYGFDSGAPSWTLTTETTDVLDPPTGLSPNGGVTAESEPTATFNYNDDDLAAVYFQIDQGNNGSIDISSGWLTTTEARYSLSSSLTITTGQSVAYRFKVRNTAGTESDYSDWAVYTYQPQPTLTLDSPASGVLWDATSDVLAHISTSLLGAYRIRVTSGTDRTKVRYDSGRRKATDPSNIALELPEFNDDGTRVLRDDHNYQINVRAWDTYDRVATFGQPTFVELWTTVHFDDDLTLTPISTITAQQIGFSPKVRVTWTRAAAPDAWLVYRGDTLVARLDPADVVSGVSSYSWVDHEARPSRNHIYSVRAVTTGVGRSVAGQRAAITPEVQEVWLVRDNGDMALICGCDVTQVTQKERRAIYKPVRLSRDVSLTTGFEGLNGPFAGWCADDDSIYGFDFQQTLDTLDAIKSNTGEIVRLVYGDVSVPVEVHDIDVKPHQLWTPVNDVQSVGFSVAQSGQFDYAVG